MSIIKNNKNYGTKVKIEEVQPNPFPEYLTVGYKVINNPDTFQIISNNDYYRGIDYISGWRYKGETEWRTPVAEITVNDYYGTIYIEFNLVDSTKVGNDMFREISGSRITEVELPASVTTIENSAFFRCGLKEMPNLQNVTAVAEDSFYDSGVLTYDYIVNDSLDRTGYHSKAFNGCARRGSIAYINGDVYDVISDNVSDLDLTNGINGLPIYRFRVTNTLQQRTFDSVKFPATLTHLMGRVFQYSTVTNLYFYGTTPPVCELLDGGNIWLESNITNIYVPAEALSAYQNSPDFADVVSKIQAMP